MRIQMMKCEHGRRVRCTQCEPPKVTENGRAVSPGRVTRASYKVRRSHDGHPLPMHLQCHPVALARTPRNPECFSYNTYAGQAVKLQQEHGTLWFMNGGGLQRAGRFTLTGTKIYGRTDDAVYAKAWRSAANHHGITVEILE